MAIERGWQVIAVEGCRADGVNLGLKGLSIRTGIIDEGCPRIGTRWHVVYQNSHPNQASAEQEIADRISNCANCPLCRLRAQCFHVSTQPLPPNFDMSGFPPPTLG